MILIYQFNADVNKKLIHYTINAEAIKGYMCSLLQLYIKLLELNVYENEHLSSMRDTLLPKLMSGELDVSDIDL